VAEAFAMSWQLHDKAARVRTLIMVSHLGHCLNDLLFRWKTCSLPIDVVGVVSNHEDFAELAASYHVPFHHISVTPGTKVAAETLLLDVIDDAAADLIVLARYMQILSGGVCKRVEGRMINIHHAGTGGKRRGDRDRAQPWADLRPRRRAGSGAVHRAERGRLDDGDQRGPDRAAR
jgi:formyltetrahydrofolate deformylase